MVGNVATSLHHANHHFIVEVVCRFTRKTLQGPFRILRFQKPLHSLFLPCFLLFSLGTLARPHVGFDGPPYGTATWAFFVRHDTTRVTENPASGQFFRALSRSIFLMLF